ncbi:unnamed protein product [Leptosia nina]|uniref:Uncharacterized protein n=1 Tax=Leptosia nina TaxID=320188 RepID=A0AAV1IY38_9NEOP
MDTPTVISVDMDYFDWNISYPAITLCPLYKTNVTVFKEIVRDKFNETGLKVDKYLWAITQANFETLHYVVLDVPEELRSVFHPNEYANIAESMFQKFGGNVSTKTNHNVTIVSAMTELGMCHVLNSNVAVFDDPRKWNVSNTKYFKNNIELSIYDRDFFIQISKYADIFKVYIHSPDEIITGTTSSFTVDMEAAISFGLSVWTTRISEELRQMPLAIRKCRFINEATSARYPIYSYSHCILECRIDVIKTLCGCVPHFYKPLAHENICHIEQLKCLVKYKKEILTLSSSEATKKYPNLPSNSRDCGCLSTCELDQYHKDREDVTSRTYVNTLDIGITSFPKYEVEG